MLLVWTFIAMVRTKHRSCVPFLAVGWLVMLLPGLFWIGRNAQAWGIPCLSVNGPLAQEWAAKAILEGAGPNKAVPIPAYVREMDLHINFIVDFSQPDWLPPRFKEITSWNRNGLSDDIAQGKKLLPIVLEKHLPLYLKSSLFSTMDVLFAPQNKHIKEFLGMSTASEPKWHSMAGSHLGTWQALMDFASSRLGNPVTMLWSIYAIGFLALYYAGIFAGIKPYVLNYRWSIWTLSIIGVGSLLFLIGPLGQSRYRFVMTQPYLAVSAVGLTNWLRNLRKKPE